MRKNLVALLVTGLFTLAGCGGGGGGGNVRPSEPPPTLTVDEARTLVSGAGLPATQRAARSAPRFGSVTQSTDRSIVNTTASTVGPQLTVNITSPGGSTISLNSALHTVEVLAEDEVSVATGRRFDSGVALRYDTSSVTLGLVAVDWDSDDPTDYLAGGYWLHATGDVYGGNVSSIDVGAFVDGPEISGTPDMPVAGTATYSGIASGLYMSRYGTGTAVPSGTSELGTFDGDLSLVADFGAEHISGVVDNIYLNYEGATPQGETYVGVDELSGYELRLGAVSFGASGTFIGSNVTFTHPTIPITSQGSWGGRFSTEDDSAGNPRLVAGTLGGSGTIEGGSIAAFVGAFYGATPEFE